MKVCDKIKNSKILVYYLKCNKDLEKCRIASNKSYRHNKFPFNNNNNFSKDKITRKSNSQTTRPAKE